MQLYYHERSPGQYFLYQYDITHTPSSRLRGLNSINTIIKESQHNEFIKHLQLLYVKATYSQKINCHAINQQSERSNDLLDQHQIYVYEYPPQRSETNQNNSDRLRHKKLAETSSKIAHKLSLVHPQIVDRFHRVILPTNQSHIIIAAVTLLGFQPLYQPASIKSIEDKISRWILTPNIISIAQGYTFYYEIEGDKLAIGVYRTSYGADCTKDVNDKKTIKRSITTVPLADPAAFPHAKKKLLATIEETNHQWNQWKKQA